MSDFRRLSRDIYVPAGEVGFWQGTFRDATEPGFAAARDAAEESRPVTVDLRYGDHEGGRRTITRFTLPPGTTGGAWRRSTATGTWTATIRGRTSPGGRARLRRPADPPTRRPADPPTRLPADPPIGE